MTEEQKPGPTPDEKNKILQRHVDHLVSQMHRQVVLIRTYQERASNLEARVSELEPLEGKLAEARAEILGLGEVVLDLKRRISELEQEEAVKEEHIRHLGDELKRIWNSPPRRLWRSIRGLFSPGSKKDVNAE